ncbi:hypothetical protein BVRB_6g127390 [Beta vulgaris subsp. vulgaris]|nr:hypothetical protein BVRB_6g127390 [Beta vulgaris subsp. vulgaris]
MEHSQSTSNFVVWHRKQGPLIPAPLNQLSNNSIDNSLILVGKFIDKRDFSTHHIQQWVDSWFTRGRIKVTKEEKLFFFHCRDMQDRSDILGLYDTMNFKGALLVLKPWRPLDSFKSFNFSESAMWIKLEGIPLLINSKSLANEIFSRIGKVLLFDELSEKPGLKKHFRALVWIKTKTPLVPGVYIEVQESRTIWIDIRYEGVFVFCKRCGKIGHKSSSCGQSWEKAKDGIEAAITEACKPEAPKMYGNPSASLYTNKIIGLPRISEYLTTIVKLNEPRRPPNPSSSSSSSDDDGDDGGDHSKDEEMETASSNHEAQSKRCNSSNSNNSGPSKRARESKINSRNYEKGGPTNREAHISSPLNPIDRGKFSAKLRGKNVLSISKISKFTFKRTKLKKYGKSPHHDDVMLDFAAECQAAGDSPMNKNPSSLPFQCKIPNHTHFPPINPITETNQTLLSIFPSLNDTSMNTYCSQPSSFRQMPDHRTPRETIVEEMESNHSSPHSSNSFTQPLSFTLTSHYPQNQDINSHLLLPSIPLEGYFENSHQFGEYDIEVNDEMHTSWEHLLGSGSTSSYFNSDDALIRGGPYDNPYPINEQIDRNELENIFPVETPSYSPQTPLQLPGSHTSLQTGSSSSYHSVFPGVPSSEFADLRIFPTWTQPLPPIMEKTLVHEVSGNKRKFDELNDIVEAAMFKPQDEARIGQKSDAKENDKVCEIPTAADQEIEMKPAPVMKSQSISISGKSSQDEKKTGQGQKTGNDFKFKIPYQLEKGKELVLCEVGPRKGSGRPPRPKQLEFLDQKLGGLAYIPGQEQFSLWRNQLKLSEIKFQGQMFTWCNNRSEPDRIYERLDRAYATEDWLHRYSEAMVLNMPILISDHSPILLITSPVKPRKKSPIKMETWCFDFKEIENIISSHWQSNSNGSPMYIVAQKCRNVRYKLFQWCKNYKEENNIKWEEFLTKCGAVQTSLPYREAGPLDEEVKKESIHKLQVQLKFWQQRAKSKWNALEDSNTKWFFRKAKRRKQRNEILMLRNSAGRWVTEKEEIENEFLAYFTNIFQGSQHNQDFWNELDGIQHLVPRIVDAQMEALVKPVSREEVRHAVFQMGSKCITLRKTYDIDSEVVRTDIVIPLKYETLQFNVLTAASIQDFPGYVTPGVWNSIKHILLSLILDHVNFNADYSLSGYAMVGVVDVSTISYVDHLPNHMFKKIVPRLSPVHPILLDDDDIDRSSDECLKKVLESLPL